MEISIQAVLFASLLYLKRVFCWKLLTTSPFLAGKISPIALFLIHPQLYTGQKKIQVF